MNQRPMIILAEPEENIRESIEMILIDEGYDCHAVCDTQSLLRAISIYKSDLNIIDARIILDNVNEILENQKHYSTLPSFLVTLSYEQVGAMLGLMEFGITEYLIKPFQFEELLERVEKMIAKKFNEHAM